MKSMITKTVSAAMITVGMLGVFSTSAQADMRRQRISVDLYDQHFQGQDQVLRLKAAIMRQYPNMNLERYNLEKVFIMAKSRLGRGMAELRVGGMTQDRANIPGEPQLFDRPHPSTFTWIELSNYRRNDDTTWQIIFDGNVKVRQAVVQIAREEAPRPPRIRWVEVGEERVSRFPVETDYFAVNISSATEVAIQVTDGSVDIRDVVAFFGNGQADSLYELRGTFHEGQIVRARLAGGLRNLQSLQVSAISPIVGERGRYKVLVGYMDR